MDNITTEDIEAYLDMNHLPCLIDALLGLELYACTVKCPYVFQGQNKRYCVKHMFYKGVR